MTTKTIIAAILCLGFTTGPALAQEQKNQEEVCRRGSSAKALDFWLGDWEVVSPDSGEKYGSNRIELALKGCAVFEHWANASGGQGKSLFYFDAVQDKWTQVWVTEDTSQSWGLKIKQQAKMTEGDGVRFQGTLKDRKGNDYLDRTTLTRLADGNVRQHIETSRDSGASWQTTFDALYQPPSLP